MKVGYIVFDYNAIKSKTPGIASKIQDQIRAIRNSGIDCCLIDVKRDSSLLGKLESRVPLLPDGYSWSSINITDCDALYIRKPIFMSRYFINWLSSIRQDFFSGAILLEIPTYPYDKELSEIKALPLLFRDRMSRKYLSKYINRIVDFSDSETIFGCPTINTFNGIDLDSVKQKRPCILSSRGLNIACAASFEKWHGIDRFIEGLRKYYSDGLGTVDIHLHLMGEGSDSSHLQELVKKYNLNNHVKFYGICNRSEMDSIYDSCSLAVASLGLHRLGLTSASTLKTREYMAKGLPFIYAGDLKELINNEERYFLKATATDKSIDISDVIDFHNKLYATYSQEQIIDNIRKFAVDNVSMSRAMQPVIDYYLKHTCS